MNEYYLPGFNQEEPDPFSTEGIMAASRRMQMPAQISIQQQRKTPISDEMYKKLTERQLESFKQQDQGLKAFEAGMQSPQEVSPLLAISSGLSDMFAGTNRLEGLTKQKSLQEQQAKQDQLRLQDMKKDLTKAEIDMLKSQYQNQTEEDQFKSKMAFAREKMAIDKQGSSKMLTASETEQLADLKDQMGSLDNIYKDWEDKVGATEGVSGYLGKKISGYTPNTDVSNYKTNLEQKAQLIGKALEGGKLTDVDFEKYIDFLPQPGDTEERARSRVKNLKDALEKKYAQRVTTFGEAGYRMGGFTPIENNPIGATQSALPKKVLSQEEWIKAGKPKQ